MAVDFGAVAKPYAFLERLVFGDALQRARLTHLDLLTQSEPARFLLTGEGDGRFLEQLAKSHPTSQFTAIDSSARMLERTRKRLQKLPRPPAIKLIQTDIIAENHHSDQPPQYDAAASHFFLDCFSESQIAIIVNKISRRLTPGGLWIITDFQRTRPGDPFLRRAYESALLETMYRFFRLTTNLSTRHLPDYAPILLASGFTPIAQSEFLNGFVRSTAYKT